MPDATQSPADPQILVDFSDENGLVQASLSSDVKKWLEKSQDSLDMAMITIMGMAYRAAELRDKIPDEFTRADIEFGVYFPQARGDEAKARRATVAAYFPGHDDDVVVLQLDGSPPLAPEQMPKLGTAEPSAFNPFRSYGYRRLAKYLAGHAHGDILDLVEPPEAATLHSDPVQLESKQINQGMSSAGVLDTERNLVVGIISEVWRAKSPYWYFLVGFLRQQQRRRIFRSGAEIY